MNGVQQTFTETFEPGAGDAAIYITADNKLRAAYSGTNGVKVWDRNGNSWFFDLTNLWMTSSFDKNGNETDYTWTVVQKYIPWFTNGFGSPQSALPIYCPQTVTYPDGQQMTFTYGNSDYPYLCTGISVSSSNYQITYNYDSQGMLTGLTKGNGQTVSYGYYTLSTPVTYSNPITQGWLTSITYASGAEVQIDYNGNFSSTINPLRVTRVSGPQGYHHSYGYVATGPVSDTSISYDGSLVTCKRYVESLIDNRSAVDPSES